MAKIIFNMGVEYGEILYKLGFVDAVLLTPKDYKTRNRVSDIQCFLETDFHSSDLTPRQILGEQEKYALKGDILIAPDVRGDKQGTIERMKDYFSCKQDNFEVIVTPQGKNYEEWRECFREIKDYTNYIGIPFIIKKLMGDRYVDLAINEIKKADYKYHLLGFSPVIETCKREWFIEAESFDSKGNLSSIKEWTRLFYIDEHGVWKNKQCHEFGFNNVDFSTRLIFYYNQVKRWVDTTKVYAKEPGSIKEW